LPVQTRIRGFRAILRLVKTDKVISRKSPELSCNLKPFVINRYRGLFSACAPAFLPPFAPQHYDWPPLCVWPPNVPGVKAPGAKPPLALRGATPSTAPGNASGRSAHAAVPCETRSWRSAASLRMSGLWPVAANSLPHAAPSITRWLSPVSRTAPRASPRGYGASLPEQIRQPGWKLLCLARDRAGPS